MNFKVNCNDLKKIADTITKGLSTKDSNSSTVFKIIEKDDSLFLEMRNHSLTSFFKGKLTILEGNIPDGEARQWEIDGNQLKIIMSILPRDELETVEFIMSDSSRLFELRYMDNVFKLPVYDTSSFRKEEEIYNIAQVSGSFLENMSNLSKLCSTQPLYQNHAFSCVHFFITKDDLIMMATNSVALSEIRQRVSDVENEKEFLLRTTQTSLLSHDKIDESKTLQLICTDTMVGYIDEDESIHLVSMVNLEPLSYEQYKPIISATSDEQKITFSKNQFRYILESLSKLCPTNDELTFSISNNVLEIKNEHNDKFSIKITDDVENTEMELLKPSISSLLGLMTDDVQMSWAKNTQKRIVKFTNIDKSGNADKNIFMGMVTSGRG